MMPIVDRGILVFIAGLFLGYLESNKVVDPGQHNENLQALTDMIGGLITIVTIVAYLVHYTVVEKHKIMYDYKDPVKAQYPFQSLFTSIRNFILKPTTEGGTIDVQ